MVNHITYPWSDILLSKINTEDWTVIGQLVVISKAILIDMDVFTGSESETILDKLEQLFEAE